MRYQTAYEILADLHGAADLPALFMSRSSFSGSFSRGAIDRPDSDSRICGAALDLGSRGCSGALMLAIRDSSCPELDPPSGRHGQSAVPVFGIPPLEAAGSSRSCRFRYLVTNPRLGYLAQGIEEALAQSSFS